MTTHAPSGYYAEADCDLQAFATLTAPPGASPYRAPKKLPDEVAAGVGFKPVEPALVTTPGCLPKGTHDARDITLINLAWNTPVQGFPDSRRGQCRQPLIGRWIPPSAQVGDLTHQCCPVLVNPF